MRGPRLTITIFRNDASEMFRLRDAAGKGGYRNDPTLPVAIKPGDCQNVSQHRGHWRFGAARAVSMDRTAGS
jgi:hypothetical protein